MSNVDYRKAQFLISAPSLKQCPPEEGAEVAFAGRSNAGKSSAINTLTENGKLARTSKTPGRTQLINYFTLGNPLQKLVDLPGYGYAKVPQGIKNEWQKNLSVYLQKRECLSGLVLLMDIRHPMQEYDTMMLNWAVEVEMPVRVLLTKADKLTRGAAKNTLFKVQKHLSDSQVNDLVSCQLFSSMNKEGVDELKSVLDQLLSIDSPIE